MEAFPTSSAEENNRENEHSPEIELVIEKYQNERAGMLGKIMGRRAAKVTETVGLMTPGVDIIALGASAAFGETPTGKKLDSKARFNYMATAGFLGLSYALLAMGDNRGALEAKGAAATFGAMQFGPDSYNSVLKMAKEHVPSIAPFIEKTGDFIKQTPALLEETHRSMTNIMHNNPDLISLQLNG